MQILDRNMKRGDPKLSQSPKLRYLETLDDKELDVYRHLNRTNRTRNDDFFIGEGRLVVQRMLESKFEMTSVVLNDPADQQLLSLVPGHCQVFCMPKKLSTQLVGFEFHSGTLACAKRRPMQELVPIESILRRQVVTVVICPDTVLPDNLGSIMRLCAGFGVDALIVGPGSADPYSRRAMRVSMGNALQLNIVEPTSTVKVLQQLHDHYGFQLVAATGRSSAETLPMPRPSDRLALIVGNEATGIEPDVLKLCQRQVSIPMSGATDSLNVATATAVLLYEFTRRGSAE